MTTKEEIADTIDKFYTDLYSPTLTNPEIRNHRLNSGPEDLPDITNEEIQKALGQMKNGKCPAEDKITTASLVDWL